MYVLIQVNEYKYKQWDISIISCVYIVNGVKVVCLACAGSRVLERR